MFQEKISCKLTGFAHIILLRLIHLGTRFINKLNFKLTAHRGGPLYPQLFLTIQDEEKFKLSATNAKFIAYKLNLSLY